MYSKQVFRRYSTAYSAQPRLAGGLIADFEMETGAPRQLEATADATWGAFELLAGMLTYNGAAVYHKVNRIAVECGSSQQGEAYASFKVADAAVTARQVLVALGVPPRGPTFIGSDNKAHVQVGNSCGSSVRSRHFLKAYRIMHDRMRDHELSLGHVKDTENPADFLTKWIGADKFHKSVRYATNSTAFVP